VGIWLFLLTFNCLNNYIDGKVMGRPVSWHDAVIYPLSSFSIWIVVTPPILAFTAWVRRTRLSLAGRSIAHLLFSIVIMLLNAIGWIPFPRAAHPDLADVPRASRHFVEVVRDELAGRTADGRAPGSRPYCLLRNSSASLTLVRPLARANPASRSWWRNPRTRLWRPSTALRTRSSASRELLVTGLSRSILRRTARNS